MKLALDTNSYVALAKGDLQLLNIIQHARTIFLPFIVVGELRAGFLCGKYSSRNEKAFQRFLASARVTILYADEQTTHHYATIFSDLKKKGKPIPTNDLWIAALAIEHNLVLHSFDKHFRMIGRLSIIP